MRNDRSSTHNDNAGADADAIEQIEDVAVVRRYLDLGDFREALERAPPGIIDERSWAYWNTVTGRYPIPPMPRRVIPDR
jgi:hypothetical protein